jgi:hypothetical protein
MLFLNLNNNLDNRYGNKLGKEIDKPYKDGLLYNR